MDDLRDRFATLDLLPVPDVWSDVERRAEAVAGKVPTHRLAAVPPAWRGVATAETSAERAMRGRSRRTVALLAAAFLLAALLVGGAIAAGSGIVRLSSIVAPSPSQGSSLAASPSPSAREATPTSVPTVPLGGGLILAQSWKSLYDRTQHDVVAFDPGTGQQALLGTLPGGGVNPYRFQRSGDRSHVLVTDWEMVSAATLGAPTDASRALGFIDGTKIIGSCCEPATTASTVLSPRGDRIALVHDDGGAREVVVLDIGGGLQRLPVPRGMDFFGGLSWAPDESALVAYGCRPCNQAQSPSEEQTPFHAHLYVIPLDGAAWRELLDVDNGTVMASWSPDGATLATTTWICPSGRFMPRCDPAESHVSLATIPAAGGAITPLATGPALSGTTWSPDGSRIAYRTDDGLYVVGVDGTDPIRLDDGNDSQPGWSPDGAWLVFQRSALDFWIIPAGGGVPTKVAEGFAGAGW